MGSPRTRHLRVHTCHNVLISNYFTERTNRYIVYANGAWEFEPTSRPEREHNNNTSAHPFPNTNLLTGSE